MIQEIEELSRALKGILKLKYPPVAVKFLGRKDDHTIPVRFKKPLQPFGSYCLALQSAFKGKSHILTQEDMKCPVGLSTLGFKGLSPKALERWRQGNHYLRESQDFSKKGMSGTVKLHAGQTHALALSPLDKAILGYDVVLFAVNAEQAIGLVLAERYRQKGRVSFSMNPGFQGICGDVTAFPYLQQDLNLTLGGIQDRQNLKSAPNEIFLGIPAKSLEKMAENLELLYKTPKARASRKGPRKA